MSHDIFNISRIWRENIQSTADTPTTTMFLENKSYRMLFAASLVAILYMWAPDQEIDRFIVRSAIFFNSEVS